MSGIELVGLAASVLQIADLGWKSSYKLYAFSKKVHDAGKSIELVSQDIAATGAILRQLGEELKRDEESTPATRLGTEGLIVAASKLVEECQTLFKEIDQGITGEQGSKVILGFKQKLKWSYLEPRVDLLRTNLERLKSSLALMLNVLIYAEQHRSRQGASVLKEQQKLVASFAEQKADSEKRIADLKKRIEPAAPTPPAYTEKPSNKTTAASPNPAKDHLVAKFNIEPAKSTTTVASIQPTTTSTISIVAMPPSGQDASAAYSLKQGYPPNEDTSRSLPVDQSMQEPEQHPELDHQRQLIDSILEEVNSSKYALDHGLRYRLHNGVLELHWREWEPLRATHGDQKLSAVLSRSPLLARHWYEKAVKAKVIRSPQAEARAAYTVQEKTHVGRYGRYADRALTAEEEEEEEIHASRQEIRHIKQQDVSSTRSALRSATESSWLGGISSRELALRKTLGGDGDKEDSNDEDSSHVSNSLRAYYNEKGRKIPEWLPADPKPAPTAMTPSSQSGQPYTSQTASKRYSIAALWDEPLSAKEKAAGETTQSKSSASGPPRINLAGRRGVSGWRERAAAEAAAEGAPGVPPDAPPVQESAIPSTTISARSSYVPPHLRNRAEDAAPVRSESPRDPPDRGGIPANGPPAREGSNNETPLSVKPEDVRSTRRASAVAVQAEESTRDTLTRIGAQGERVQSPPAQAGRSKTEVDDGEAKEPKRLNKSMFAVHVANPFTAKARNARREKAWLEMNTKAKSREQSDTPLTVIDTMKSPKIDVPVTSDAQLSVKTQTFAERSKYQLEADSEDEEMEAEIENNVDFLSGAAKRLNLLGKAMGGEVDSQNKHIGRLSMKSDKLDGSFPRVDPAASIADGFLKEWTTVKPTTPTNSQTAFNKERLARIR